MTSKRGKGAILMAPLLAAFGAVSAAEAAVFSVGDGGTGYSAKAEFTVSGTTLTIKLTNTSTVGNSGDARWLTGLLFNLSGATLSSPGASVPSGSSAWYNPGNGMGPLQSYSGSGTYSPGDLWGVATGVNGWNSSYDYALTCVGAGAFDLGDTPEINGTNYGSLDGDGGAIIGSNVTEGNGYNPTQQNNVYYKNSLTFTFTISDPSALEIDDVRFAWGSGWDYSDVAVVPLPPPAILAGVGLLGLAGLRRLSKKA